MFEEHFVTNLYKVFRDGIFVAEVSALDEDEAIELALSYLETEMFPNGAETDEDAKQLDKFLRAIFTAERV